MVVSEEIKREIRNTHKWNEDNICIYCGGYRKVEPHPNNEKWTLYVYYDKETGEETRKLTCKTNQLLLL